MSRRRTAWPLLLLVPVLTGCLSTISLPLGGVTAGRGRALGAEHLQFVGSLGTFADVAGALPAIADSFGNEVNPIPALGQGAASGGGLDLLGLSYGFTDRVDLGLNFSRGLHGFVEVVGNDVWSLTASPSLYRYSVGAGGTDFIEERRGAVTNVSLSLLGSYYVPAFEDRHIEVYAGGAVSRYSAWITTESSRVEGREVVPTLLGGVRSLRVGRTRMPNAEDRDVLLGLSIEGGWTWIRQRNGRRDTVPTLRAYLSLVGVGG